MPLLIYYCKTTLIKIVKILIVHVFVSNKYCSNIEKQYEKVGK